MTTVSLLRLQAEVAFDELLACVEGIDEALSWAVIPLKDGEYFHHSGSILGTVQHIAECKYGYASAGFRGLEMRVREIADKLDVAGSSWARSLEMLQKSQDYWMASWADLQDEQLMDIGGRIQGDKKPLWQIIHMMTTHDYYHAGQIEMLKSSLSPTDVPPESMADMARKWGSDLPTW